MNIQNDFKIPKAETKKEKGKAIEKILENSNKPWYLNNSF